LIIITTAQAPGHTLNITFAHCREETHQLIKARGAKTRSGRLAQLQEEEGLTGEEEIVPHTSVMKYLRQAQEVATASTFTDNKWLELVDLTSGFK